MAPFWSAVAHKMEKITSCLRIPATPSIFRSLAMEIRSVILRSFRSFRCMELPSPDSTLVDLLSFFFISLVLPGLFTASIATESNEPFGIRIKGICKNVLQIQWGNLGHARGVQDVSRRSVTLCLHAFPPLVNGINRLHTLFRPW